MTSTGTIADGDTVADASTASPTARQDRRRAAAEHCE